MTKNPLTGWDDSDYQPREYPAFPAPDPNVEYPVDDQPDATYSIEENLWRWGTR